MALRVVVCLKQTLDTQLPILIGAEKGQLEQDNSAPVYVLDLAGQCALEQAMWLKESANARVSVLTLGPHKAEDVLRYALARGADTATHLVCGETENWDAWSTANTLCQEIYKQGYDLVICGERSTDDSGGITGPYLAECLGIPQVTNLVGLEIDQENQALRCYRQMPRGDREIVTCFLPALITVSPQANHPQYVSIYRQKSALRKGITRCEVARPAAALHPGCAVIEFIAPRQRSRKIPSPSLSLSATGRMNFLLAGGKVQKEAKIYEGNHEEAITRLVKYLKDEGFI